MEYYHFCNNCGNWWQDYIYGGKCPSCDSYDHTNTPVEPCEVVDIDDEEWTKEV